MAEMGLGIDVGGTNVKALAVDDSGQVLSSAQRATPGERAALIKTVAALLDELPDSPALGISAPGLVRRDNRAVHWMRNRLAFLEGLDWTEALEREAPVLNDGHAAALAEGWCGAGAGLRYLVMLTLGTGVGGGVLFEGRPLQGALGRAGHLGHITLDQRGERDIVNTPGSLEDLVGDHTVEQRTQGRYADTQSLVRAAQGGDAQAMRDWDDTVHALACGIASLINAFDPEAIILGGGIAQAGEALLAPLREKLDRYEWRPTGKAVPVRLGALGEWAGAIGAARFAITRRLEKAEP